MKKVVIYTDGSCFGNPGPGGYAAILLRENRQGRLQRGEISGYEPEATNNSMELKALIAALNGLTEKCEVEVRTDSKYLISCQAHEVEWLTRADRPNRDLWIQYLQASQGHKISFVKVQAHGDDKYNNEVDKMARAQIKIKMRSIL